MQRALERRKEELRELERDTSRLETVVAPFPRISYSDAVNRQFRLGTGDEQTEGVPRKRNVAPLRRD